jgi:hypothetical protein
MVTKMAGSGRKATENIENYQCVLSCLSNWGKTPDGA